MSVLRQVASIPPHHHQEPGPMHRRSVLISTSSSRVLYELQHDKYDHHMVWGNFVAIHIPICEDFVTIIGLIRGRRVGSSSLGLPPYARICACRALTLCRVGKEPAWCNIACHLLVASADSDTDGRPVRRSSYSYM